VVVHYTAIASYAEARARLCDPHHQVSAHWLVGLDGHSETLVPEAARAWHAGAGAWGEVDDVNSRSIGIELVATGGHPFPEPQMARLETLLEGILARHGIPPWRVIAHSDLAPHRKADPGPRFDWRRLALRGLSVWPGAGGDPCAPLPPSLAAIGYRAPAAHPEPADLLLRAFRLRFRPWATGPEDATDRALADDLARRFAVDRAPRRA
jgi:N-acetylmuramoyl-L-alanine amidase